MELMSCIENGDFVWLEDSRLLDLLNITFADEIGRLKKASPTIEASASDSKSVPGSINGSLSPSKYLFRVEYAEVNRSLVSLLALKWLLSGDYETFTRTQSPEDKLTNTSFNDLRSMFISSLPKPEDMFDLIISMIVSDVGKDHTILEDLEHHKVPIVDTADHDEMVYAAARNDVFPSISSLPTTRKDDIVLGLAFGAAVNVPQLIQAESVPASLEAALLIKDNPRAFDLKFSEIILDVAGAGAHIDARCAGMMSQSVVDSFLNARNALKDLLAQKVSIYECYDRILSHRSQVLAAKGLDKFSVTTSDDRALLRLLSMGRVYDKAMGIVFKQAFDELAAPARRALVEGLKVQGPNDRAAVLPYYMPGLIAIGLRNTVDQPQEARVRTLQSLFRLLARVLQGPISSTGQESSVVQRNVSFAKAVVSSEAFKFDPTVLDRLELPPYAQ